MVRISSSRSKGRPFWAVFLTILLYSCFDCAKAGELASKYEHLRKFESEDTRTLVESALELVGLDNDDLGRSYAVIGFRDSYPEFGGDKFLPPARRDAEKLFDYLRAKEKFDEIFVLENDDFNVENLRYLLTNYLRSELPEDPKSRFLFAYSGHGANDGDKGYLIDGPAKNAGDIPNAIQMSVIASMLEDTVAGAHYTLILLNSCFSGSLERWSFSDSEPLPTLIPKERGAHVIMAGGSDQKTWGDSEGSYFFQAILSGLNGDADDYPKDGKGGEGDGLVTAGELAIFLREQISAHTEQKQTPRSRDLLKEGSNGSFFFFNRQRQVEAGNWTPWSPPDEVSFGDGEIHAQTQREPGLYANQSLPIGTSLSPAMLESIGVVEGEDVPDWPLDFANHVRGACLASPIEGGERLLWRHLASECE